MASIQDGRESVAAVYQYKAGNFVVFVLRCADEDRKTWPQHRISKGESKSEKTTYTHFSCMGIKIYSYS